MTPDPDWRKDAVIIEDYMPPYPRPDTRPAVVIRHGSGGHQWFLRYSRGPRQGHFWDNYGEDYLNRELAELALSQAPPPPNHPNCIRIEIPLKGDA